MHRILQKIIDDKKHIKDILSGILTENLIDHIILEATTKNEMKEVIVLFDLGYRISFLIL